MEKPIVICHLKALRDAQRLSLRSLARKAAVNKDWLHRIERQRGILYLDRLGIVAQALGVNIWELVELHHTAPPPMPTAQEVAP